MGIDRKEKPKDCGRGTNISSMEIWGRIWGKKDRGRAGRDMGKGPGEESVLDLRNAGGAGRQKLPAMTNAANMVTEMSLGSDRWLWKSGDDG